MLIIPAIDLKGGKCVRLRQGKMDEETVFSEDPLAVAQRWVDAGARRMHIVDLDGAASGVSTHTKVIGEIASAFPDLPLQVGGGIRDEDRVQEYLDLGIQYVVLGTRAVTQPHFVKDVCIEFPRHIIVGLDVRDGKVATSGWSKLSHHDVKDLAKHFEEDGVAAIIFTDISRDGMLNGVNVEATREVAESVRVPIIASGGVASQADVKRICEVADEGIEGLIIGRALYQEKVDFKKAQALADSYSGD